jgi:nitroimidazol reductase NimA-like FMN-containing flavoprotein (pyridoxamine 5'-phosphate oxidase superfamily)
MRCWIGETKWEDVVVDGVARMLEEEEEEEEDICM